MPLSKAQRKAQKKAKAAGLKGDTIDVPNLPQVNHLKDAVNILLQGKEPADPAQFGKLSKPQLEALIADFRKGADGANYPNKAGIIEVLNNVKKKAERLNPAFLKKGNANRVLVALLKDLDLKKIKDVGYENLDSEDVAKFDYNLERITTFLKKFKFDEQSISNYVKRTGGDLGQKVKEFKSKYNLKDTKEYKDFLFKRKEYLEGDKSQPFQFNIDPNIQPPQPADVEKVEKQIDDTIEDYLERMYAIGQQGQQLEAVLQPTGDRFTAPLKKKFEDLGKKSGRILNVFNIDEERVEGLTNINELRQELSKYPGIAMIQRGKETIGLDFDSLVGSSVNDPNPVYQYGYTYAPTTGKNVPDISAFDVLEVQSIGGSPGLIGHKQGFGSSPFGKTDELRDIKLKTKFDPINKPFDKATGKFIDPKLRPIDQRTLKPTGTGKRTIPDLTITSKTPLLGGKKENPLYFTYDFGSGEKDLFEKDISIEQRPLVSASGAYSGAMVEVGAAREYSGFTTSPRYGGLGQPDPLPEQTPMTRGIATQNVRIGGASEGHPRANKLAIAEQVRTQAPFTQSGGYSGFITSNLKEVQRSYTAAPIPREKLEQQSILRPNLKQELYFKTGRFQSLYDFN
tara:strand:+ start:6521 stop:8395 length:1875 start_codon:yes stop_codon:yes gene_type:complete